MEHDDARSELEARLRYEILLADLSATFVNQPSERIDEVIDVSLQKLVRTLGHDRSTVAEFQCDDRSAVVTHSFTVPGAPPFPLGGILDARLPWYFAQLRRGKTVFIRSVDELPPEAAIEKQHCMVQGIQSNVTIPLKAGGVLLGAITFAFLRQECSWDESFVRRLQIIGEVFANAMLHKRHDEALHAALAESQRLRDQLALENEYLREQYTLKFHHGRIIGKSHVLQKALADAEKVAATDAPVLLLGETGTGKELLAQTIHDLSTRKDRPMVVVSCAALPATLIESELFGREAGAYTGAASAQAGRFTLADGSTLFLDEIGELPQELQAKLLRVVEDGRFERLGSPETLTVNVRLISATNRDLEQAVREGRFRADLYHRLSVFPISMPPLRDRREDIPLLIWGFVEALGQRMGKSIKSIPKRALQQLQHYDWPGNVRELRNVIERALILSTGDTLHLEMPRSATEGSPQRPTLRQSQREQILRVLEETNWRIRGERGAAAILGLKPTTLESRMAKLGIKRCNKNSEIS
jgi:formate hydrogenlyase transcriptional activator